MPDLIPESAFAEIFTNGTPLLDVRAPVEFHRGAFPNVTNLPLLTDDEREAVGSKYKQQGQQAAITLGTELVGRDVRAQRLSHWLKFLQQSPSAMLYCFRGGIRSQIVQDWLQEQGCSVARIEGGYKALRNFLLDTLARVSDSSEFLIVAGKTGSGKTHLIRAITNSIDLEGLANHRGSAFGKRTSSQPNQINFENNLAIDLLKLPYQTSHKIFLEDESRAIGSLSIPLSFHRKMLGSQIAIVEEAMDFRVGTILNDYIVSNYLDYKQSNPAECEELFATFLLSSLERIKKRLGGKNYDSIKISMQYALTSQRETTDMQVHQTWIKSLLLDYYDPMYDYQLNKKSQRVVFRGSQTEFLAWSHHLNRQSQ